jgi:hypothetical protein
LIPVVGLAVTRHVPSQYSTIQAGLDASWDADTVLVAPGTYTGPGNRNLDYRGTDIVLLGVAGPKSTIVDCNRLGRGFYFHSEESRGAVLEGFTITNGIGVSAIMCGGGILIDGSYCTIRNCRIENNEALYSGGGIYIRDTQGPQQPTIEGCVISGNRSGTIGGYSGQGGGGIGIETASPTIFRCAITGNYADPVGGGLWLTSSATLLLTECTFSGNRAVSTWPNDPHGRGGAICGAPFIAERCIFWGNCSEYQHEINGEGGHGLSYLLCCAVDVAGISESVRLLDEQVQTDPLFCSPDDCGNAPSTAGTYTLCADSPCLPENSPCGEAIGAFGSGCGYSADVQDLLQGEPRLMIFPNPSCGPFQITYRGSASGAVAIQIQDVAGRVVRHLASGQWDAGRTWDRKDDAGHELPAGVYFIHLATAQGKTSGRVVVSR